MKPAWILPIALALALVAPAARADVANQLIDAAYRGDLPQAQALLAGGAPTAVGDVHGDTPLHWAAREGHLDVVKLLLAKGAPIDALNRNGESALMQATSHGRVEVVKLLLATGASLEPRDRDGHGVVDLAMQGGMDQLIVMVQEAANGVRPDPGTVAAAVGAMGTREALMGLEERLKTLGPRIDALPFGGFPVQAPPALPLMRWVGQKFMFMPMERDNPEEAPSFSLGGAPGGADVRNVAYETLVGRIGTVLKASQVDGVGTVMMRLDDDGTVLTGTTGPRGNLPELAPALDLYVARKLYTGKILWPKDCWIDRYTRAHGQEARLPVGAGEPVLVRGVFPGENAANPVRLVLETGDGRQGFLDMTLSGTNAPVAGVGRQVFRFNDLFFTGDPRRTTGWGPGTWAEIRAGHVLHGFTRDEVRAAWGRPGRIEGQDGVETWSYTDPDGTVTFRHGRVVDARRHAE